MRAPSLGKRKIGRPGCTPSTSSPGSEPRKVAMTGLSAPARASPTAEATSAGRGSTGAAYSTITESKASSASAAETAAR